MGHTVVLGLDDSSSTLIQTLMAPFSANKIPFGRNCDRDAANTVMGYHMTLCHWAKARDGECLARIKDFHSVPCQLGVQGTCIMPAEEGSWLLYFDIVPGDCFMQMKNAFEKHTGLLTSDFYHVTLAVSKNHDEIREMQNHIQNHQAFPFVLTSDRLDLYRIWTPTRKADSF